MARLVLNPVPDLAAEPPMIAAIQRCISMNLYPLNDVDFNGNDTHFSLFKFNTRSGGACLKAIEEYGPMFTLKRMEIVRTNREIDGHKLKNFLGLVELDVPHTGHWLEYEVEIVVDNPLFMDFWRSGAV